MLSLVAMAKQPAQRIETGRDLAAERVRKSLRAVDVAERMGVSRQRVTNIEQLHRVPAATAERYLQSLAAALDTRTPRSTEPGVQRRPADVRAGAR